MKILYLTTSLTHNHYAEVLKTAQKAPNPSNQNFHHALISAIAHYEIIQVISITPITPIVSHEKKIAATDYEDNHIPYHSLSFTNTKFRRRMSLKKQLWNCLSSYKKEDIIIMFDTMNYLLSSTALSFAQKYNIPTVGVLTDNPQNITNMPKYLARKLMANMPKCTMYIGLTKELIALAKGENKPHIVIEGLYEDMESELLKKRKPYMFFGGALYARYGIKNLIMAYNIVSPAFDLVIAGDGPSKKFVYDASLANENIKYVGLLNKSEIIQYEQHAVLNINPRPYDAQLNSYSIPSKVIEYAGSGRPTLSTEHERLHKIYGNSILWCKDDSIEGIKLALDKFIALSTEKKTAMGESAQKITQEKFGPHIVGQKISAMLKKHL